ncbi:DUF6630 family protein [Saccharothrix texasensis]|uniref:DUF6630 domain-containing protein n=1 Tax=Saccharothrix texasensis TaxID=103734 RepID=A0A3N1H0I5_9PSEU|nr:DUF6630 family protein [Saccharothrix texasensis]ROP36008.1 hypothetical protein EDD40_1268 [Saccharothrix texasensis]
MSSTVRDALVALAALLAPDAPDVADRVTSAHDAPATYLRTHADRLDDRGIDEPLPELAWIALVDALTDHDLLAEVDWKEAAGEIVAQLRSLRSGPADPRAWDWFAGLAEDLPAYDFLERAGRELRATGTTLAVLDIESDCYPLVLLPNEHADTLRELATATGFTAGVLGEPAPPATPPPTS